jgi:hypothetical protein
MTQQHSATPLLEQMAKLIGTYEGDDGNEHVDEGWDLHIPLCKKLLKTVADHLVPDETWPNVKVRYSLDGSHVQWSQELEKRCTQWEERQRLRKELLSQAQ